MKLSQSFTVPYPSGLVWGYFQDLPLVTGCIPGAELVSQEGNLFKGRVNIRVGPILAAFSGEGRVEWNNVDLSGKLSGRALDSKTSSQAQATLSFALLEVVGNSTEVNIDVDFTLSGMMAQFGRGNILKDIADRLTKEFAANLKSKIGASESNAATAALGQSQADPQKPPQRAMGLSAGSLLWRLLVERLGGLVKLVIPRR